MEPLTKSTDETNAATNTQADKLQALRKTSSLCSLNFLVPNFCFSPKYFKQD